MIYELEKNSFCLVSNLFSDLSKNHLQINSVLDSNTKGKIFVDHKTHPTISILWERQEEGEMYLAGKPNSSFLQDFNKELKMIIQNERNEDFCDLTLYWEEQFTQEHLQELFSGLQPHEQKRFQYKIKKTDSFRPLAIPSYLKLYKITKEFIKNNYENMEDLIEWTVVENHHPFFSEHGYGMCLLNEKANELVSWCCFDYFSGSRAEIGIETASDHRKKGFAGILISNVVAFLFEHGYDEIGWHCWNTNIGSLKTAEKVGFMRVSEKPVQVLIFNSFDNYAHQAHIHFDIKHNYESAAICYEKCVAMMQEKHTDVVESGFLAEIGLPVNHFLVSAALAWANCNKKIKTFENLDKIQTNNKQRFLEWINQLPEFKKYHDDDEWRNFQQKFE